MAKTVKVKKDEQEREFELQESVKTGYNWFLPRGSDGHHFKSLKSAEKFFARRFKGAEITIS